MEVTKSNFKNVIDQVKSAIEECTFIAVDTELTGLHDQNLNNAFDTMADRYVKMRKTAGDFLVIQVGVSCFRYHSDEKKYTHKDFNFYVFGNQHIPQVPDTYFKSSVSSLRFLSSHKFDFNKLFHEGVSYLTHANEEKVRQFLESSYEEKKDALVKKMDEESSKKKSSVVKIPEEHQEFINGILEKISDYVESDETEPLCLPPCNGFLRWIIYQSVSNKHPSGLSLSTTNDSKRSFITVTKLTDKERIELLDQQHAKNMNDLDDAIGFRKVLEFISQSKKLVLGHNMLLDIFHLIDQFLHPAPETLDEFKDVVNCIFPHILDTKTLASSAFKTLGLPTALFELQEDMINRNFTQTPIERGDNNDASYTLGDEKSHEAGYDAFVTGVVFVNMITKLAEDNKVEYISPNHKCIRPYINRPYIMRHYDIQSLNLHGPDPEGRRDNVFFVTFPKTWRTADLVDLFHPYGEIYVSWMDEVSAFIALKSPEQSVNVKRTLLKHPITLYKVMAFADYHRRHLAKIPDVPPKKRINSTSNNNITTTVPEANDETGTNDSNNSKQGNCVSPTPKRIKVIEGSSEKPVDDKIFDEPVWEP